MKAEIEGKWNPDHSISKGYPFEGMRSREMFKNRPILAESKTGRIFIDVDKKIFPEAVSFTKPLEDLNFFERLNFVRWQGLVDFLLHRIFDYRGALEVAETQINDMLAEAPFVPEEFGFEKIAGPTKISDSPTKIYSSKYNGKLSIFRKEDTDYTWVMLEKETDAAGYKYKQTELYFPCHRIAYAAFIALGIKIEEVETIKNNGEEMGKETEFKVVYEEPGKDPVTIDSVTAFSEPDAQSKAKFIIETGDFGVELVLFEHLKVTPIETPILAQG